MSLPAPPSAMFGNSGDDAIDGRSGDDVVTGGGGRDVVRGGAGDDLLEDTDEEDPYAGPDPDPGGNLLDCGPGKDEIDGLSHYDSVGLGCEVADTFLLLGDPLRPRPFLELPSPAAT